MEREKNDKEPITLWLSVKKDMDAAFDGLVGSAEHVPLKKAVIVLLIFGNNAGCVVTIASCLCLMLRGT